MMSSGLIAEEVTIRGSAFYLERITLPKNAVFEVTLEDVSLMDVAAVVMGHTIIDPIESVPIDFTIHYKSEEIQKGHRYNMRGKITVNGRLIFITDTAHPVLTGKEPGELKLRMKKVLR